MSIKPAPKTQNSELEFENLFIDRLRKYVIIPIDRQKIEF